jgi:hypothetical protein
MLVLHRFGACSARAAVASLRSNAERRLVLHRAVLTTRADGNCQQTGRLAQEALVNYWALPPKEKPRLIQFIARAALARTSSHGHFRNRSF